MAAPRRRMIGMGRPRVAAPVGAVSLLSLVPLLGGCGPAEELGQVDGRVLLDGRPLEAVRVSFLPDPERATRGSVAWGVTDASGRYRLAPPDAGGRAGVAVGWHRITIEDVAAENARDATSPEAPRIDAVYSSAHRTPLRYEVRSGRQTKDLRLGSDGV